MKLNNKGITLVEVIVSFALLMIILVGLFNIIMEVKSDVTDKQMEKEFKDFDNLMIARIQGDLIKNSVTECSLNGDKNATCGGKTISLANGKITYNGIVYDVPYSTNDILVYSNKNNIEIKELNGQKVLIIIYQYGYMEEDTADFPFGFTIIHPLSKIN